MKEYSILELQKKMTDDGFSARSIVKEYLQQIKDISEEGPAINAVIEINPHALDIADKLDAERKMGKIRGPLHGIPVMLKDIIETGDKMHTSAGSLALKDHIAKNDAYIVKKLREAGAIILGKNTLSEWGNFRSTNSVSGWSSKGGQAKNPYVLDRNPCGSSSGTATAVAANLCSVGVGGETDGSIICPSQTNGVVGLKPTLGLLSRTGIIPISHSQDTAGPIARTVTDAAILLGAMVGVDVKDEVTHNSRGYSHSDYSKFLDKDGLQGARIGVARNLFGFNEEVDTIIDNCIQILKDNGAVIIENTNLSTVDEIGETEMEVLLYDFKNDINNFLKHLDPSLPAHTLEELIAFNNENKKSIMPYFGMERFEAAQEKGELTEKGYIDALANNHRLSRDEGIDAICEKHNLDAIIAPSGGPAWKTDYELGDTHEGGSSSMAAVSGYPNLTVPAGYINDLPIGISFMCTAFQEGKLLKIGYAFEQASQVRKPPRFLETLL